MHRPSPDRDAAGMEIAVDLVFTAVSSPEGRSASQLTCCPPAGTPWLGLVHGKFSIHGERNGETGEWKEGWRKRERDGGGDIERAT